MMRISSGFDRILDSKASSIAVFAIMGASKLVSDYSEAPEDKKDTILLRDSLILGGSALGVGAYEMAKRGACSKFVQKHLKNVSNKIFKSNQPSKIQNIYSNQVNKKVDKTAKFVYSHLKNVAKDCADNCLMVGSGIVGAMAADYAIQASRIEQNKYLRKLSSRGERKIGTLYDMEDRFINTWENSLINKNIDYTMGEELKSNIFSQVTNMPAMKMFNKTMVGMQGFEVIEEKTFKDRMHHATKCIIGNTLVPMFFLSTSASLTKNMKSEFRAPLMLASMVAGTMYTNKLVEQHNKKKKELLA
jgi:hypothetical protein